MRSSYFKCCRLPRLRYVVILGIAGLLTTAHLYLLSAVFEQNVLQIQHEQHNPVRHPSASADAVNGMPSNNETIQAKSKRVIRIVRWTPPVYNWLHVGSHYFRECTTAIPCEYTNQSSYNSSDIIMINAFHLRNERDMPAYRLPHQKWLFYHTEAPRIGRFKHLTRFLSSFNVTLTYSGNADIVKPYGVCLPNHETVKKNPSSITDYIKKIYGTLTDTTPWLSKEKPYVSYNRAAGKSRLVAWMVSDCTAANKRSDYAKLLQRYIPVDVYGKCGNLTCLPRLSKACEDAISKKYKFYLAFENSLCLDYITEKVWTKLERDIVPIVLGGVLQGRSRHRNINDRHRGIDDIHRGIDDGHRGIDDRHRGIDDIHRGIDDGHRGIDDRHRGIDDIHRGIDDRHRGIDDIHRGIDDGHRGIDDRHHGIDDIHRGIDDGHRGIDDRHRGIDDIHRGIDDRHRGIDDGHRGINNIHRATDDIHLNMRQTPFMFVQVSWHMVNLSISQ
ncbi:Alpha-(1,3)-fucosyltransferase C [Lamellibrachia satsuma]|nr:Alpha-(1,3)-fucosyltransferase C [Lamellibrachia satsuma]